MKGNPFYFGSAAAMLAGCYILSKALALEPGRLGKLLVLMGVVQLYEWMLVGAGVFLVSAKRGPRDGLTLLVLESVFLLDATLLANECATVDLRAGTFAAAVTLGMAVAKLWYVAERLPKVLSSRAALLLGAPVALVLAMPVVAAHLASLRALNPVALYACSWAMLALPLLRRAQLAELRKDGRKEGNVWTALPTISVVGHLMAVAWVHDVTFAPALFAPLLLGFAFTREEESWYHSLTLTLVAALLSAGQAETLGFYAWGTTVTPVRLVFLVAGVGLAVIGWERRSRGLLATGAAMATLGVLGDEGVKTIVSAATRAVTQAVRFLYDVAPKGAVGWGVLAVVSAFVLLAIGLRRSLEDVAPARHQKEGQ
jgi:hypothetical protein